MRNISERSTDVSERQKHICDINVRSDDFTERVSTKCGGGVRHEEECKRQLGGDNGCDQWDRAGIYTAAGVAGLIIAGEVVKDLARGMN